MKRLFIVYSNLDSGYEGSSTSTEGIFSTEQKAIKVVEMLKKKYESDARLGHHFSVVWSIYYTEIILNELTRDLNCEM